MAKPQKIEISEIPIANIIQHETNARTHSKEQINQIAASIKRFGFTNPILVDDKNNLIAGHGRTQAAILLKMESVPAIVLKNLSEAERRALILADNKIALNSGWDRNLLKFELDFVTKNNIDFGDLGFNVAEYGLVMSEQFDITDWSEVHSEKTDPYEEWKGMPEYEKPNETAWRSIIVHFNDQDEIDSFKGLIGQNITDKTRFVYFSGKEKKDHAGKEWVSGE